jgi:hypothetical protein
MSPDPSGLYYADPTNPQTLNLYAYVLNNPLKFVDPTGMDCAYLNDAGDGIEDNDQQSNQDECKKNGGYWAQGGLTNFQVNSNGSYTFTSLDSNNNTLYTNYSGSSNSNSFVNLDVMSYFMNDQIQQRQLQQMPDASSALAQGIARDTGNLSVGLDCATKAGYTGAASYFGISPTPNPARQVAESASGVIAVAGTEGVGAMAANGVKVLGPQVAKAFGAFAERNAGKVVPGALAVQGYIAAHDAYNAYNACNGHP